MKSCCCFSLRTGGLIFGWLGIIMGTLNIVYISTKFISGQFVVPLIISFIFAVIGTLLEVLWIHGIHKNKAGQMLPSLVLTIAGCVITLFGIVLGIIVNFQELVKLLPKKSDKENPWLYVFMAVLFFVCYVLVAVEIGFVTAVKYYLYKEIKGEHQAMRSRERGTVYNFPVSS